MRQYEITFIVSENYNEDKAKSIAKEIRELIESRGGKIEKDVYWGKRKLAYKIAKNTFGYYFVFVFSMESDKVNTLNRDLNLNDKIIRYLIGDYIENTSFFEEVGTRKKEGGQKPDYNKTRKQENNKAKKQESTEEITQEETKETPEIKEEIEKQESNKTIKQEIKEENPEIVEEIEKKEEEEQESKKTINQQNKEEESTIAEAAEDKEIEPKVEVEEKKETKEEEEQPKRKKMTDDERKAALDAKLAELLKDEE